MKKLIAALTFAVLTASPVLAAAKHHNGTAQRFGVEQLNRDDLYQSYSQGRQSYPVSYTHLTLPTKRIV